jgi:hypothetical protein
MDDPLNECKDSPVEHVVHRYSKQGSTPGYISVCHVLPGTAQEEELWEKKIKPLLTDN